MEQVEKGALYLVATPIGHLGDITYRAVEILKQVDLIAAEDTRTSRILLNHYHINRPMISFHSHNSAAAGKRIIERLERGESVALISDAGTPGISDPGYTLVKACVERQIRVIPLPGATALIPALVASGFMTHRFAFEGFLPAKKGRQTRLKQLTDEERTLIFYESPHKIRKTVQDLLNYLGDRPCVMAREITKKFEQFYYGTLSSLLEHLQQRAVKGEIVLLVQGKGKQKDK